MSEWTPTEWILFCVGLAFMAVTRRSLAKGRLSIRVWGILFVSLAFVSALITGQITTQRELFRAICLYGGALWAGLVSTKLSELADTVKILKVEVEQLKLKPGGRAI